MRRVLAQKKTTPVYLGWGAALLLLAVLVVFLAPLLAQSAMLDRLSKATQLPVSLGELDFSLFRPRFSIKELQFSNPKGFPDAPLTQIAEVKASYSPWALAIGRFDLRQAEIHVREFRLVRNEAGELNLPPVSEVRSPGDIIDELIVNLRLVTYTDLSEKQPVQKTFDVGLMNATYRNVEGIMDVMEILNWEILKRTGVELKKKTETAEVMSTAGSQAESQSSPESAPQVLPESSPSLPEPSPAPSAPGADAPS